MTSLETFINYINEHTNNGLSELGPGWGDNEYLEDYAVELLNKFEVEEWLSLKEHWKDKSDLWLECFILLVSQVNNQFVKDILVSIARNGSKESTMTVMEYVREFWDELDPIIAKEIDNKSWSIIKSKMGKA